MSTFLSIHLNCSFPDQTGILSADVHASEEIRPTREISLSFQGFTVFGHPNLHLKLPVAPMSLSRNMQKVVHLERNVNVPQHNNFQV